MAKNTGKRKRSNRVVATRLEIDQAKYAKSKGLLSKRAKLGNGKLSRAVKKKVARLEALEVVPIFELRPGAKRSTIAKAPTRKAVKLKPSVAREYREKGFATFGNFKIQPKDNSRFKEFENSGLAFGTTYYGFDVVDLAVEGVENYADLHKALKSGKLDRYLNNEHFFSFTFFGEHPLGNRSFLDGAELADYLERYRWTGEAIDQFQLVIVPGDVGAMGNTPPNVRAATKRFFNPKTVQDRSRRTKSFKVMTAEEAAKNHAIADKKWRESQKQKFGDANWKAKEAARKRAERGYRK